MGQANDCGKAFCVTVLLWVTVKGSGVPALRFRWYKVVVFDGLRADSVRRDTWFLRAIAELHRRARWESKRPNA
jgi:hypothetical protein